MATESENRGKAMDCTAFDALLTDAIDGVLVGERLTDFHAHAGSCADCGPLFTQAQAGMNWMKKLVEIEPPANLVHNILAVTSMAEPARHGGTSARPVAATSWMRRACDWVSPSLAPALLTVMQPRFAMTAAMAFFSITMVLNVAGVKLSDMKNLDLRPSAISTSASMKYNQTTARVVRYYQNMRVYYKSESLLNSLRTNSEGESGGTGNEKDKKQKNNKPKDNTERPVEQRNENFTMDKYDSNLALLNQKESDCVLTMTKAEKKNNGQDWRLS